MIVSNKLLFDCCRLALVVLGLCCLCCDAAVTLEQMDKAAALMGEICLKKFKPSAELRAGLHKGEYPDIRDLKCYVNCVLEMLQTMKKGKLNYDSAMKQIDVMLPDDLKEPTKKSLETCKSSANGIKDNCDAGYAVLECFYKTNPQFFFP